MYALLFSVCKSISSIFIFLPLSFFSQFFNAEQCEECIHYFHEVKMGDSKNEKEKKNSSDKIQSLAAKEG